VSDGEFDQATFAGHLDGALLPAQRRQAPRLLADRVQVNVVMPGVVMEQQRPGGLGAMCEGESVGDPGVPPAAALWVLSVGELAVVDQQDARDASACPEIQAGLALSRSCPRPGSWSGR
jgi:hypothetical protein